jgi:hypothetical protein
MRISQIGAIALVIIAASLACAGADEPTILSSETAKVNVNVAEMAQIRYLGGIALEQTSQPPEPTVLQGSTTVEAYANFDYELHFAWFPPEEWNVNQATLSPTTVPELEAQQSWSDTVTLTVYRDTTDGGPSWGSVPPAGQSATSLEVPVTLDASPAGSVLVTLSHHAL